MPHDESKFSLPQMFFHIGHMTTSPGHPKIEVSQSSPPGFDSGLKMREIVSVRFIDLLNND